jgi:flavin reductase (DIM6/NTAB) family NADH-FMN oxidoreductase RutF
MHIDLDTLSGAQRYFHMIDVVVPRPIAWVSTLSNTGQRNLAPFSFFTAVSSSPPCIMLSVAPKRKGRIKDTLSNIKATGEFVVNLVQADLAKPMVETSAEFESDQDEFTECDVLSSPSRIVKPPRVKRAHAALECNLFDVHPICDDQGRLGSTMVIGRVVSLYLSPDAFDAEGKPNQSYGPIARLGGRRYLKWGEQFDMKPGNGN